MRNWEYVVVFLATLGLFLVFGGRILCGFMCPLGFIQDLFDQFRRALHIRSIPVTDRMNQVIQPLKWIWLILFLGFVFVGGDFCDICPNKVFSTAMGGWWVNYALGGFLAVPLLAGSFFIKRFWCLMCGECIDKCPENKALSMTFCGKAFYQSSRETFMSKFARKQGDGKE